MSFRVEIGTEAPPIAARDLPSELTDRLIMTSPLATSAPSSSRRPRRFEFAERIRPSTKSCFSPVRTLVESARSPSRSPRAVRTMVLPAPVSPVSAVKPGASSRFAELITPIERIESDSIKPQPPDLATLIPEVRIF